MADTFFIEGLNTLPEQVQINKEDIKKLSDSSNAQIQALTTKVDTNTANIVTNATDIDNLSKKVYNNGTLSFQIEKEDSKNCFTFKDNTINTWFKIISKYNNYDWSIHTNSNIIYFYTNITIFDSLKCDGLKLRTGIEVNYIDTSYNDASNVLLTASAIYNNYLKKTDASNTYLTKTDASSTYATKTELSNANKRIDALDTGTFDVDLTTSGLAKIKANVTIGTPITLTENTDFSQYLDYTNYKTVIFTLYIDDNEEYFISTDIKLNVGDTADVYGDNDQNYTWLTGIGVIKLGPNINGNNYLCYISYSQGYTSPLVITPIQKLA